MKVYTHTGFCRTLGSEINKGATGRLFELQGLPGILAKIFSDDHLSHFGPLVEKKVKAQISRRDFFAGRPLFAWPRTSIYDADRRWIGYSMKRVTGVALNRVAHQHLQKKYFPDLDRIGLIGILLQLVDGIRLLHRQKIFLGDFNPENFLVDEKTLSLFFIDTDGYQVDDHRCLFVKPEYLPLEHLDLDPQSFLRSAQSDEFSLAILLFQLLMRLRDPFDSIGCGGVMENRLLGRFPYGKRGMSPGEFGAIPIGPWYTIWSHLSYDLKNCFVKTFTKGAKTPRLRVPVDEWYRVLNKYGADLSKGFHERQLSPPHPKLSTHRSRTK